MNATKISSGNSTREERRKNATGQAVVFNRGGGGQKIGQGNHHTATQKKPSHNTKVDYRVSQTISKKEEIII